jgi:hypothetical protein
VWVALIALAALASVYRSDDNDYWFHIAAGRSIVEHGLPARETWCLAARGQAPWLSEWLFHVALYEVHRWGGDLGVALWRAGWTAAAMALAVRVLFLLEATSWSAAAIGLLVIAGARERFQPRPEQIFVTMLLLAIVLFESARRGRPDRTRWLVPAQILWANLQGSWVFGPAVAWVYAASAAVERFFARRAAAHAPLPAAASIPAPASAAPAARPGIPRAVRWGALGLVLWAASAVVPMPLETLARPFRFLVDLRVDPLTGNIQELRPWSWAHDRADPFTALLLLWVLSQMIGGHRMWKASPALTLLGLGGFVLGVLGVRFRGLAAWLALAPLAVALAPRGPRLARWALAVPGFAAGAAGVVWLVTAPQFTFGIRPQLYSVPVRAAAVAESLHLEGPMLNTFHHGGYLLWARGEKNPPLIDGRGRGSYEFRSLYARAQSDAVALDSLLETWDFNYIIIEPPQSSEDRLPINIARHLEYGLIFYDDSGLLYLRSNRYPQVDRSHLYRYFTPDYLAMTDLSERALADSGLARLLTAELERARAESPFHSRACLWLGLLAVGRMDGPTAVRYLDEAAQIAPAMPGLALRQGFAHAMIDDAPGAIRAFRRALRDPEDRDMARAELESLKPRR